MGNPIFETVASVVPNRNLFDLSHEHKFTARHGSLVPSLCLECIPGDSIRMKTEVFLRYAPMLAPMFQRVDAFLHFFFVPSRLVYDQWNNFLVGGPDGTDTEMFIPPYTTLDLLYGSTDISTYRSSLIDYFGLPSQQSNYIPGTIDTTGLKKQKLNLIPFRAYQLIYDYYYRDENLEISHFYNDVLQTGNIRLSGGYVTDTDELIDTFTLQRRAYRKDYFTISLPWAQKGPQVLLPLLGTKNLNLPVTIHQTGSTDLVRHYLGVETTSVPDQDHSSGTLTKQNFSADGQFTMTADGVIDLSTIGATSLNDFRVAIKTQEWLEKNARGGCGRYIETILVHFGVRTPDARLQMPEYITGVKLPVQVSEVPQTSAEFGYEDPSGKITDTTPAGTLYGKAVGASQEAKFDYYCYEHGFLFCIFSALPRQAYFQGIPRMFQRFDKFDYYWPSFAHLGEQEVKQKEIYMKIFEPDATHTLTNMDSSAYDAESTFGYQSRYCEYKTIPDKVSGMFVSELDYWHMARKFCDNGTGVSAFRVPNLVNDFVKCAYYPSWSGAERVFSGQGSDGFAGEVYDDPFYVDMYFDINALRPIPTFSIPSF